MSFMCMKEKKLTKEIFKDKTCLHMSFEDSEISSKEFTKEIDNLAHDLLVIFFHFGLKTFLFFFYF